MEILQIMDIQRFSFERRKLIGFALTTPHDWPKKLTPLFHPIRRKTSRGSFAHAFPRFASATLHVITWSFDWFPVSSVSFVIG